MVRRKHTLTEGERSSLNRAAHILEVKQEDLAELASVSQAWLSITLSGKRAKREVENISRLAQTLLGLLQEKGNGSESDRDEADEITRVLKKLVSLSEASTTKFISPPGRVVPASAENYVQRSVDTLVDDCLESGNLSMYVVGPFQAGKTSLLLRLRDEAKRKGFETAYFSCKSLAKPRFFSDSASVFRLRTQPSDEDAEKETEVFFRSLKEKLVNTWGLSPSPQLNDADFPTWAEKLLKFGPDHQAIIVLDDLGSLSPLLRYKISSDIRIVKNTNSFVSFARGLVEGCPISLEGRKEEGKFGAAVAISSLSTVVASSSGSVAINFAPALNISSLTTSPFRVGYKASPFRGDLVDWWFNEDQLRTLSSSLGANLSDQKFADIYDRYRGQPLFSHLVIANADARTTDKDFKEYVKNLEVHWSAFEQHKNLVRVTLVEAAFTLAFEILGEGLVARLSQADFLEKLKFYYPKLLKLILGDGSSSEEETELVRQFLAARRVISIEANGEVKPSCDWYREIAEQLSHEIADNRVVIKSED